MKSWKQKHRRGSTVWAVLGAIALGLVLIASNPGRDRHMEVMDRFMENSVIRSMPPTGVTPDKWQYNNYLFFSTLVSPGRTWGDGSVTGPEGLTFGLFGRVWLR